jgi:nucleoside-triphosphatase THEP1
MSELIFVEGEVGSGKSLFAFLLALRLSARGVPITGVVSNSIFENDFKIGYEAVLLPSFERYLLCNSKGDKQYPEWLFNDEVFYFGNNEIAHHLPNSQILIIDEVGTLEIEGKGWHPSIQKALQLLQSLDNPSPLKSVFL